MDIKDRPTVAKGNRPFPLGNSHIDRVLSITMAIASEVAVLYDRLDTLERVASEKTQFSLDDLRQFQIDDEIEEAREQWRQAFIRRMLRILLEEASDKSVQERNTSYQDLVRDLAE